MNKKIKLCAFCLLGSFAAIPVIPILTSCSNSSTSNKPETPTDQMDGQKTSLKTIEFGKLLKKDPHFSELFNEGLNSVEFMQKVNGRDSQIYKASIKEMLYQNVNDLFFNAPDGFSGELASPESRIEFTQDPKDINSNTVNLEIYGVSYYKDSYGSLVTNSSRNPLICKLDFFDKKHQLMKMNSTI